MSFPTNGGLPAMAKCKVLSPKWQGDKHLSSSTYEPNSSRTIPRLARGVWPKLGVLMKKTRSAFGPLGHARSR